MPKEETKIKQNQQGIENKDIQKHLDNDLEREFMDLIQSVSRSPIFSNRQRIALAKALTLRDLEVCSSLIW